MNYSNPQPMSGETCHQGSTPPYSIAISSAQDASDIVNWATTHNVMLTIKNTGGQWINGSCLSRPFTCSCQVMTISVVPRARFRFRSSHITFIVLSILPILFRKDRQLRQSRPLRSALDHSWKPVGMESRSCTPLLIAGTSFSLFRCGGKQCFGRFRRLSDCRCW